MDFEALYAACFHKVYRFALSLTRSAAEAEEVAQETFFRAMTHIGSLPDDAAVDAWLIRIARNTAIARQRKRRREVSDAPIDRIPSGESIEDTLADRDQADQILRALHTLPEPYKEVFTLRALGEIPYRQIALLFSKGEGWARVCYHRARMMLLEIINKEEQP